MRWRLVVAVGAALLSPAAYAEPVVTLDGHNLVLPSPLAFAGNSARMAPDARAALDAVRLYLEQRTYISALRIEGHAPDQALSEARARTVAKALVGMGVDCKRLIIVGFGPNKPVAAAGDASNTRITFVNAALRGRAIGGLPLDGGGNSAGDACAI